ncbi:MAG: ABC transporter ATP-binding protein [Abditibacteriaceae bacterium]
MSGALIFDSINKTFGETIAVNNLSLTIENGELFFLIGPSGCGKTTSLRMVAGFEEPDSGAIRFNERDLTTLPPHQRNTGMVFQNYALWPHLTVRGNVEYGLKVRKLSAADREKKVKEALEMVRLTGLDDRYPNQLSGGQQQRVALARALVIRPDVLLLDEPLSNLDAQLRLEMRHEIRRLHQATGITTLYVTHDQEEALSVASRIAVLKDGLLQQVGTPREIYRQPNSRFVAEFIGETNFIPGIYRSGNNGTCKIETPCGELIASASPITPKPDQEVWCSIRPEAWHLVDPQITNKVNLFPATMLESMYLGSSDQYKIQLDSNDLAQQWSVIKVLESNPGFNLPQARQKVLLYCDPNDVVVLEQ